MQTLRHLLVSMRPRQWSKNLLLFAGVLFAHQYGNPTLVGRAFLGFAVFCIVSGAIYLINDCSDLASDRLHPRKRLRPVPAGLLAPSTALAAAAALGLGAVLAGFRLAPLFGATVLAYFVLTVLYTRFFKHVVVLDVLLLALGFVLRAVGGVVVIRLPGGPEIPMTPWFVICVFFLALFIAICKRRHELLFIDRATEHRSVLGQYTRAFLDQMISVCTSATIFSYVLYLVTVYGGKDGRQDLKMILTLPFVVYGIFRYLYLVYRCSEGGEPESMVMRDKPLLLSALLWLVLLIFLKDLA